MPVAGNISSKFLRAGVNELVAHCDIKMTFQSISNVTLDRNSSGQLRIIYLLELLQWDEDQWW